MAKQLVIKVRAACLADKTVVNYFQVVRAVIASAVSSEGEQLYPRNWNFHFIGLPIVDESQQKNQRSRLQRSSKSSREPKAATRCCSLCWQALACESVKGSAFGSNLSPMTSQL